MPKIDAPEKLFFSLLGKEMTDQELIDIFPVAKAELDGRDFKAESQKNYSERIQTASARQCIYEVLCGNMLRCIFFI